MNGGRGAKGSINDRLISLLYRQRYKEYMKKLESYNKQDRTKKKEYLVELKEKVDIDEPMSDLDPEDKKELEEIFKDLDVNDMQELFGKSNEGKVNSAITTGGIDLTEIEKLYKSIELDSTAAYVDKNDFYEIINRKTPVGSLSSDEVIDVDKEVTKTDDEITIIEELTDFIDESTELLSEIKFEITSLKKTVIETHTEQELEELNERYKKLKEKVTLLKEQYLVVSQKYEFEDFEILDNIKMMDAIEEYKDLASLEELETLTDACREEIESIDGVLVEEQRRVGLGEEIKEKKEEIKERDTNFALSKEDTIYYTNFETSLAKQIEEQKKLIAEFWVGLENINTEVVTHVDYIRHTDRMLGSLLRIATGILTLPFSNMNMLGMSLGTNLINRGVRRLRDSLNFERIERHEVVTHYTSIESDILRARDSVKDTKKLIDDTIAQVDGLEKDFKLRFSEYAEYIPEYYKILGQIEDLSKKLSYKKEEIKEMDKTLDNQYENNKQKVLRASR